MGKNEERLVAGLRPVGEEARTVACIGKSVVVKGEVTSSEDLIVNGQVEGTIDLQGHNLTVGVGGAVRANIAANTVTIHGAVTGNVLAIERIDVRETGSIDGDIGAPRVAVSAGAVLRGRVETTRARADAGNDPRPFGVVVSEGPADSRIVA